MKKVTVAVIGCGTIARDAHMSSYTSNPMAEVKYVVDINPEKARASGEKYGIAHIITDYREILQDPEVEAVLFISPTPFYTGARWLIYKQKGVRRRSAYRLDLKDYTYVDMWAGPSDYDGVYDV